MTIGKISAVTLGFVGAFALGVWTSPRIVHRNVAPELIAPHAELAPESAKPSATRTSAAVVRRAVPRLAATTPELQDRLKTVLNRGANMDVAAEGFRDAEQFATVAHAARNTEVPFVLLKHRVLNEGKTIAEAIRESKPAVDASVEADLAHAQAKADIAMIAS
jgi:hypothetical protein